MPRKMLSHFRPLRYLLALAHNDILGINEVARKGTAFVEVIAARQGFCKALRRRRVARFS